VRRTGEKSNEYNLCAMYTVRAMLYVTTKSLANIPLTVFYKLLPFSISQSLVWPRFVSTFFFHSKLAHQLHMKAEANTVCPEKDKKQRQQLKRTNKIIEWRKQGPREMVCGSIKFYFFGKKEIKTRKSPFDRSSCDIRETFVAGLSIAHTAKS